MHSNLSQLMDQAITGLHNFEIKASGKYSPSEIRLGIQNLVALGNMPLAQALTDAALTQYPESEELLAMAGLMALTQEDWGDAIALLEQLLCLQGAQAPAMTYRMLVRALRCNLEPARAQRVLAQGLEAWPLDADLMSEKDDFLDGPAVMPTPKRTF